MVKSKLSKSEGLAPSLNEGFIDYGLNWNIIYEYNFAVIKWSAGQVRNRCVLSGDDCEYLYHPRLRSPIRMIKHYSAILRTCLKVRRVSGCLSLGNCVRYMDDD